LREWFDHQPARYEEFTRRSRAELDVSPDAPCFVELGATHDRVTLLFAAHDPLVNHAVARRHYLSAR